MIDSIDPVAILQQEGQEKEQEGDTTREVSLATKSSRDLSSNPAAEAAE